MKPEEIMALRKELRCTTHELAEALGVTSKTVMAWEQDEMFPTKRYIKLMNALREQGQGAVPRKRRGSKTSQTPMQVLSDPDMWRIVRKLVAHPEFRAQVTKLAESYDEPE
jgi:DNA-binding XRE family transcriptional regulator